MRRAAVASLMACACLFMVAPAHATTAPWRQSGEARELPRVSSRNQAGAAASPSPVLQAASSGGAGTGGSLVPFTAQGVGYYTAELVRYVESGIVWVDGIVMNTGDTDLQNLVLWREWDYYGHTMDRTPFPPDCWLLRPSEFVPYSLPRDPNVPAEPGVVQSVIGVAERATIPLPRVDLHVEFLDCGPGIESGRWWEWRITNETSITVDGVLISGYEDQSGVPWVNITGDFLDTLYPESEYPDQLAPGESFVVVLWGGNPSLKTDRGIWGYVHSEALEKAPISPVYRFYNVRTGTHFYTASAAERDRVRATLSVFRYEGPAFGAFGSPGMRKTALYRFYNVRTGTHFYTASEVEKSNVIATLGTIYKYEGPAFYVADYQTDATATVYRFYNRRTGTHFYTASEVEKSNVINKLSRVFTFEGPAYSVPK